jgi:transaldolase
MTAATEALSAHGVAIWLDDLSRARLDTGTLAALMAERDVVGVTTNPSIFQAAITGSDDYAADIARLAADGVDAEGIVRALTTDDVRRACEMFLPVWEATEGQDGRVSIEVDPRLAHDTDATIAHAAELWAEVDRPNLLIKIPGTAAGLPAIRATIAAGISVNVTLLFSVERYRQVLDAYHAGLEDRLAAGQPIGAIHSVASFFVSRVDTAVDPLLAAPRATGLPPCSAPLPSPTPGLPTAPTSRWPTASAGGRSRSRARTCSGRCGPPPGSRTRTTLPRCTSRSSSLPAPSTPCPRRPSMPWLTARP